MITQGGWIYKFIQFNTFPDRLTTLSSLQLLDHAFPFKKGVFEKNARGVNSDSIFTNFTSVTSICRVYNE